MKVYTFENLSKEDIRRLCRRNPIYDQPLLEICQDIFSQIEQEGDKAIRRLTKRFDGVDLEDFRVDAKEFRAALEDLPAEVGSALELAARNIRKFHSAQQLSEEPVDVEPGVKCWRAARSISSIGLYVPGGTAVLPSTVLMLGIPAKLAGCTRIVLCVPPRADGSIDPVVVAAAQLAGIRQVFKIGGAQAVAAMALGTESVPSVQKILGPGNRYVQTAKLLATLHGVSIDMVAGPSEVLVIADKQADPEIVASDLISQAEHGADSQVVLISPSSSLIERVETELARQLSDLPRKEAATKSLEQSFAVKVRTLDEAFDFSNQYAPEHLILNLVDSREWLGRVQCAGSVFVGKWSPEVAGDYASGTNHTLPTSGSARSVSGVSMDSFVKKITFQELTGEGLASLGPALETLAGVESLEGHARAVRYRLKGAQQ